MQSWLRVTAWPVVAGILAALLVLEHWVLPAGPEESTPRDPQSFAAAVQSATPAVVNIYTSKVVPTRAGRLLKDPFWGQFVPRNQPRQRLEQSLGSGVIFSADGHVVTNNHVIDGADEIQVLLSDGRNAAARIIGTDRPTDLALLKIDLPDLTPIPLGTSADARVGDVVLAIGNPLGFGQSVTQGIISGLERYGLQPGLYESYIQTDAIIHQGNSGGALVDTEGRLVGINTLIYTSEQQTSGSAVGIGIGLAIPVDLTRFVVSDLIEYGQVIRGWLGVQVEPRLARGGDGPTGQALVVTAVAEGGPAQKAGLQPGDVITHFNGEAVEDVRRSMYDIALLRPGESLRITAIRGRQTVDLRAVVGAQTQSPDRQGS
ncbi:S1C family serine protease [Pseudohaliea rubra]|uniref:Outer membrane stress sensor protease DegS n=1 Tax=Pseudohaliea rubra DSM 19751 TaxID=1265313 RepID=A0A095WX96_9GAMM|nr:trypsin-like peptidase domain-containing protein [Pseudohaliea rubra]KGE03234.1 Outer membrane stress sensor protease DegS [Pseudohaliea rubra DSM 19751]